MGISQKINMVPMQIAFGFSQGIMPLVSYNYASGAGKRMKDAVLFAVRLSVSFLVVVAIGYYIGSGMLISLFMSNEQIIAYGSRFLRGFCLALPFFCTDFLAVGVFQACGMGKKSLVFALLRKIVLEIPALFLLNYLFPLYGLAYAQFLAELILSIAAVFVLRNILKDIMKREAERNV